MKNSKFKKMTSVKTYGYTYSKKDFCLTIFSTIMAMITICYFQKLNILYTGIVLGSLIVLLPGVISAYFFYLHEQRRFEEYCQYFESVRMYFKVYGKLTSALKETRKMFPEHSKMAACIEKASICINETGQLEKGLQYIENQYENTYLKRLHALLVTGEQQGGDSVYYNLDLIDYENWKQEKMVFQKKKKSARYMFYLMTVLSFGISMYSVFAYQDPELQAIMIKNNQYQFFTFIEIEIMMVIFFVVYVSLVNKKWLRSDE